MLITRSSLIFCCHFQVSCYRPIGCSIKSDFFVFINGMLVEVEEAGLGVELSNGVKLFADSFVGVS